MENQEQSSPSTSHSDASRPSLGFPLGTALLLIVIFSLSGFFSCCYHWDKLRSLRRSFLGEPDPEDPDSDSIHSPSKPTSKSLNLKQNEMQSLPVLMPGDQVPKFIALPCPCESFRPEKIAVEVQTPSPVLPQPPPPPPRMPLPPPPPTTLLFGQVARFGVYYEG